MGLTSSTMIRIANVTASFHAERPMAETKALAQADGDAADHGTGNGADAAQNGCNEGLQAQHGAHGGVACG